MFRWGSVFKLNNTGKTVVISLFLVLFVSGIMGLALYRTQRVDTYAGFSIDDSWIHAAIARNLVSGDGYGINANQWLPVSTAPAWTLLIAFFMLFIENTVTAIYIAALVCQSAAVIMTYLLAFRWSGHRFWSAVPAVLLTLHPILLWGFPSGLEIPLVAFAVLLCMYVFDVTDARSKSRMLLLPLSLLLAVFSRPELFLLVPMAIAATAYQNLRQGAKMGVAAKVFAVQCLVFVVGVIPYFAFNYATTGYPFPTAFYAKVGLRDVGFFSSVVAGDWSRAVSMIINSSVNEMHKLYELFLRQHTVLFLLAPLGIATFFKPFGKSTYGRIAMPASLLLLLPLVSGIVAPTDAFSNYFYRYYAPYVPGFFLMGGLGLWALWHHHRQRTVAILCLLLTLFAVGRRVRPTLVRFAQDVKNTNVLYVESGQWIRDNIDPSITIAVNDIGGIAYFIENRILDIMGLGSTEIWPYLQGTSQDGRMAPIRAERIRAFLKDHEAPYLVMSPNYYRVLHADSEVFEPIKRWDSAFPTGRAIDPQIMYRLNWEQREQSSAAIDADDEGADM